MDSGALLLPEPFSEKNIDGSPITKASEGRALFKNSGTKERQTAGRRSGTDRRSGTSQGGGYGATEREYGSYGASSVGDPGYNEPVYNPPLQTTPSQAYNSPVQTAPPQAYNTPVQAPPPQSIPVQNMPAYGGMMQSAPAYDPEKYDPPVDEKPGMIKNPLPVPPVKKKAAMDYDMDDTGYGDYDSPLPEIPDGGENASMEAYGDYDYGDEGFDGASSGSYDDYGFADDSEDPSGGGFGGSDSDDGYYGFDDEESGVSDGFDDEEFGSSDSFDKMPGAPDSAFDDGDAFGAGSDDFPPEDGGYGDYDDGGADAGSDSDYGDYDSGSDSSSDYY